jgi:sodium transport system permease protein
LKRSDLLVSSQLPNPAAWPALHAFIVFFIVWILTQYLAPRFSDDQALIRSGVLQLVLGLGLPLIAIATARLSPLKVFKLRFTSTRNLLLTVAATPCLVLLLDEIRFLQSRWTGPESNSVEVFLQASSVGRWVELILFTAIVPAVCEESLFRGYLLERLSAQGQTWRAIMVSSVLFGLFHQSVHALLPATVCGIFFAFLAVKTESLLNPIVLHMTVNVWAIIVANSRVSSSLHWPQNGEHLPLSVLAICSMGILLVGRFLSK